MKIHTRIGLTLRIFSSGMAADMITTEMIKIHKDFNERFADLQKQKNQSERREYNRIAHAKDAKILQDSKEAENTVKQISKLPSSSESPSSSNDESNQKTTRKQEVIKTPEKNNIALLSPPKGKQLAAKPLNQTSSGDGEPLSFSDDESNKKTTRKQEVIKIPEKKNNALLPPPKGKQRAAKPSIKHQAMGRLRPRRANKQ